MILLLQGALLRESEYRSLGSWTGASTAISSAWKAKELVVDFQKQKSPTSPVPVQGENSEVENTYRYLDVQVCDKLGWEVSMKGL